MFKNIDQETKNKNLIMLQWWSSTTYFAYKIDEAIQLFALDYEIAATGYNELFKKGDGFISNRKQLNLTIFVTFFN